MAEPTTRPNWIPDNTTGITVPSGSKQNSGWTQEEKPAYEFFNWFFNIVSQWFDFLKGNAEFNVVISSDTNEGDFTTFAGYIAGTPAAGDRVLIKESETISSQMVIPNNISIKMQKGKKFTCSSNLANVIEIGTGVRIESDMVLDLTHTGTITDVINFNGNSANIENIQVNNSSTGTVTNVFVLQSPVSGNMARGETTNTGGGTLINIITDNTLHSNNAVIVRDL